MNGPHGLESLLRRQPSDERKHGGGEEIVTVARYHMPCTSDIDVIGLRHELKKFFGMRLLHESGGWAAHKQGGDPLLRGEPTRPCMKVQKKQECSTVPSEPAERLLTDAASHGCRLLLLAPQLS
jgi:hypothetical protein